MAEADGFVEVCAVVLGQLARDVEVELRTEGDTASEFCIVSCIVYILLFGTIRVCTTYEYTCELAIAKEHSVYLFCALSLL